MATEQPTSSTPVSPVETRQQAYRRMIKIRHRLFWLHPTGLIVAIIAAGGDAHKLHRYATTSLTITIIVHIAWALQLFAMSKLYRGQN